MVLMEAMAARMPVIGPKVAELVEDGVSGFAVPPGDADTLGARMVELMESADRLAAMGTAGRAKVEADFDTVKEARRIARFIEDIDAREGAVIR